VVTKTFRVRARGLRGPGLTEEQQQSIDIAVFEHRTNVTFASPLVVDGNQLLIPAFDYYSARTDTVAQLGPPNSGLAANVYWPITLAAAPGQTARIYHDLAEAQAGNVPFVLTTDEPFASTETKNIVALYRDGKVTPMEGVPLVSTQSGGVVANQVRYGKVMDKAQRLLGQSNAGDISDAALTALGFTRGVFNAYTLAPGCGGDLPSYDPAARSFARVYQQTSANFSFAAPAMRFYNVAGELLKSETMTLERVLSTRAAAHIWRGTPHPQAVFWRAEIVDAFGYTIGLTGPQFAVGRDAQWILRDDYPVPVSPAVSGRRLQAVSTRFNVLREFVGSPTYTRTESRIKAAAPGVPIHGVRLVFANALVSGGLGEFDGYNAVNVTAAVEPTYTPAIAIPVTFNGRREVTLDPGAIALSDPVPGLAFDASNSWVGGDFFVRTGLTVGAGGRWPQDYYPLSAGEGCFDSNSGASQVYATGPMSAPSGGASSVNGGFGPIAVVGYTDTGQVSVVYLGDSIADGVGDDQDGYIARALADVNGYPVPYIKLSRGSDTLGNNALAYGYRRRALFEYGTHGIIALGTNDIVTGASLETMKNLVTEISAAMRGRGLKVIGSTIWPRTTSTDSWATLANQTPVAGFAPGGVRDQFNAWIKNYADGLLDHWYDPCEFTESPSAPGKWNVNGSPNYPTTDGVHPTPYFHYLAAQTLNRLARTLAVGETAQVALSYASLGSGMTSAALADALRSYGVGIEAGSVAAYQMRAALQDQGKLQDVIDALPSDPTDAVAIRWHANAPVKAGDQVAAFIASTLSYNTAAMNALFAAAAEM
jgi:lysophospholipase L1-like esterase